MTTQLSHTDRALIAALSLECEIAKQKISNETAEEFTTIWNSLTEDERDVVRARVQFIHNQEYGEA